MKPRDRHTTDRDWLPPELCEDRLMPSAAPAALPVEAILTQHGQPDFWIDGELLGQTPQTAAAGSNSSLHASTGVQQVRDQYGFTGSGQTVAVIDTGIAWDHYALGGGLGGGHRVVGGWDFAENDANPYDDGPAGFHGTHVAGIVGSDDTRYSGVAPDADLVALRVFDDQGRGNFTWVESALRWVHQHRNDFANPITTVNLSLGTTWNANTVPNWSTLEDEFAQLKADGIFISVSAGNSFAQYGTKGLSYPGSSPSVVPVASVGADGLLSYFSQRNERVLAAPGENITSTAPDYLYGFNGRTDDWVSASGTSMAAPYVAGASTLVREAMTFVGRQNITEDDIYQHFVSTADRVYDPITRTTYNRIDVAAAIDALIVDEAGATVATARSLGPLMGGTQVSGAIGKLADQDYFTFTATQSGSLRATLNASDMTGRWDATAGGTVSGNTLTLQVVAGQQYTIGVGSTDGLGHYQLNVQMQGGSSLTNVGSVGFENFTRQAVYGERWYQATASRDGTFTAAASFGQTGGAVGVTLYDQNLHQLASNSSTTGHSRVDFAATAGQAFYVRLSGQHGAVDLALANLVRASGTRVDVAGTAGDDTFVFIAGESGQNDTVRVNNIEYSFSAATTKTVTFDGGDGRDTAWMVGTSGVDRATLRYTGATLAGSGYTVTLTQTEQVTAISGGGADIATLEGNAGDDRLAARPLATTLSNATQSLTASGFATVTATGLTGNNTAEFWDSAGNDLFTARVGEATLTGSGYGILARGFGQVTAYAGQGNDQATLYDSAGVDNLSGSLSGVTLAGTSYSHTARGFDVVTVLTNKGTDTATLSGSAGNDTVQLGPKSLVLSGGGATIDARGFENISVAGGGGTDSAAMTGTSVNDLLSAGPRQATLRSTGYQNSVSGFATITVNALGGTSNRAELFDSAGNDALIARPKDVALVGQGYEVAVRGFQTVTVTATAGGHDTAQFFDSARSDTYTAGPGTATMRGPGYANTATGFDVTSARAQGQRLDSARLIDSAGVDRLTSGPAFTTLAGDGFANSVSGFRTVKATATPGAIDTAVFEQLGTEDDFTGQDNWAASVRGLNKLTAIDFEKVIARPLNGTTLDADLQAVDYLFEQE